MKKIAIVALLSALAAAPAVAADIYVGANVAQNTSGYSGVSTSTGFGILGGYSFSDSLAAELAYSSFGDGTYSGGKTSGSATSLAAVFSLPVGKDFAVKGKLGYAMTSVTCSPGCTTSGRSDITYGIGGQYNVSKTLGVTVGYDILGIGGENGWPKKDGNSLSVGVVYKL